MAPVVCAVCSEAASKYKCPQCLIRYCSLACFKAHKEVCSEATQSRDGAATTGTGPGTSTGEWQARGGSTSVAATSEGNDDEGKDRVSDEQLQALASSAPLRDMLHNHHLRDVIRGIDNSPNPTVALKAAIALPIFSEFSDECLRVVAENGKAEELVLQPAPPANPLDSLRFM